MGGVNGHKGEFLPFCLKLAMAGVKLVLAAPFLLLFLLFQSTSGDEICGVKGYSLNSLYTYVMCQY